MRPSVPRSLDRYDVHGPLPLGSVAQHSPLAPALHEIYDRRTAADVSAIVELNTGAKILTVDRDEPHSNLIVLTFELARLHRTFPECNSTVELPFWVAPPGRAPRWAGNQAARSLHGALIRASARRHSSPSAIARSTAATKRLFIVSSCSRDQPPSCSTSIGACATNKLPPPFKWRAFCPRFSPGTLKFDMGPRGCVSPPEKSNTKSILPTRNVPRGPVASPLARRGTKTAAPTAAAESSAGLPCAKDAVARGARSDYSRRDSQRSSSPMSDPLIDDDEFILDFARLSEGIYDEKFLRTKYHFVDDKT